MDAGPALALAPAHIPSICRDGHRGQDDLELLLVLKQLKYFWSHQQSQLGNTHEQAATQKGSKLDAPFATSLQALTHFFERTSPVKDLARGLPSGVFSKNAAHQEQADLYVVYPTSFYRQSDSLNQGAEDASTKNLYGAYHYPMLIITDRGSWRTLHPGWHWHGVAEIIKLAVMKEITLYVLMVEWGSRFERAQNTARRATATPSTLLSGRLQPNRGEGFRGLRQLKVRELVGGRAGRKRCFEACRRDGRCYEFVFRCSLQKNGRSRLALG